MRCAPQLRQLLSDIQREVDGTKGRYILRQHGAAAEMTYSILSPTRIIVDHTGVPNAMRGTGAGKALILRLVEDARAEGVTITPLCPFVRAQAAKHPEWSDVFE